MERRRMFARLILTSALVAIAAPACAQSRTAPQPDPLLDGFRTPPESAKPRTWWHWTQGNITQEGITKDLEWMKRVGIGGFMLADVAAGSGQEVAEKIHFGTPEWLAAVRHTAQQAEKQGLEMSLFSSAGWSLAGGPWVTPEMAMKRLVWSETELPGGKAFAGTLARPPATEGWFRDFGKGTTQPFYRDASVIAYRIGARAAVPTLTASENLSDFTPLLDDKLATSVRLTATDGAAWVQASYARPFTARAVSIGARGGIPVGKLQASDDGVTWRTIATTPGPQGYHGAQARTIAFPAVTARHFRFSMDGAALRPGAVIIGGPIVKPASYELLEFKLSDDARVNRWEDKGAFGSLMDVYEVAPTPAAPSDAVVGDVVDLTSKMAADGSLKWTPPAGNWRVIRFGYANTGARNRPSVPAGSGLEVDKLNGDYVTQYVDGYLNPIQQYLGPLMGKHPTHVMMDSWEAGMQNWTDRMPAEFKARRGYDMTPYMPVLTGHVVQSAEVSDRFLWDFRRTLADLYADEFYASMDREFGKRGLSTYSEASGVALEITEDTLRNKGKVDIPMAEFWVNALHPESEYYVDVRGAASAGHIFGKNIVASEAFTGGGYESPFNLKRIADYWFAQGINRLVFHTSAHQPTDAAPGNTMVGAHINRNITWANQASGLMTYFARVQHLLQQGRAVADVAYLLPQGAPSAIPFWGAGLTPALPKGYDYDVLNADALLLDAKVAEDGSIVLSSGARYRVLALPQTDEMSPQVAAKLEELVNGGAWIVGRRPKHSVGLTDYPRSQMQVEEIAERLWGGLDGQANIQRAVGKGMVFWGMSLDEALQRRGLTADVDAPGDKPGIAPVPAGAGKRDAGVAWIHRTTPDADIYFVASQADSDRHDTVRFRVTGRMPELWDPMTGETRPASYRAGDKGTDVMLDLAPRQSVFVLFRKPLEKQEMVLPEPARSILATLDGTWNVTFPASLGAPAQARFPSLASWTENSDPGIKNFSGTATYDRSLTVPRGWLAAGQRIWLDLGNVRDIAEVVVNGKSIGSVWAPPYRIDLTGALKAGANRIEVRITNEWINRIAGDASLPEAQRVLKGMPNGPGAVSFGRRPTAQPSGLLGPVRIVADRPAN